MKNKIKKVRKLKKKGSVLRKIKDAVVKEKDSTKKGKLLFKIAESHYDLQRYTDAIKYYERAIKSPLPKIALAVAYDMLGSLYQELKYYKKSIHYHKLALKKKQPKNRRAAIYTNLGRIYFNVYHKDNLAFDFFHKALELFNPKLEYYDEDFVDHCHFCLGVFFYERGDIEKAKYYYEKVLKLNNPNTNNAKVAKEYLRRISVKE